MGTGLANHISKELGRNGRENEIGVIERSRQVRRCVEVMRQTKAREILTVLVQAVHLCPQCCVADPHAERCEARAQGKRQGCAPTSSAQHGQAWQCCFLRMQAAYLAVPPFSEKTCSRPVRKRLIFAR